jgi:predicted nucleic acid-binding protein
MSAERITLDTNILIYAFDQRDAFKQRICADIVVAAIAQRYALALQAIGEFYVASTRRGILTRERALAEVERLKSSFETFLPSRAAYTLAAQEAARGTFSYWDAILLISATDAGCDVILSEDMADGARLGSITVRNPFGPRGLNEEARAFLGMDS